MKDIPLSAVLEEDDLLLKRFQKTGQLQDLGRLYHRYIDMVYGLCLKYLPQEDAEDAVMDIFEELVRKVPRHQIDNFKPWLYVLARNHCLMRLRKEGRNPVHPLDPADVHSEVFWHPISEQGQGELEAQLAELERCLDTLNEDQAKCIRLFYLEDFSYKEIAQKTGWLLGKVRSYMQNGRRNLRLCMENTD